MDDLELEALARLFRGENRAAPNPDEFAAMADVGRNRIDLEGYPDTLLDVLYQPGQFQPLSPLDNARSQENAATSSSFGPNHPEWAKYIAYAQYALDPARARTPYTHYYSGSTPPPWARKLSGLTKIGSHYFGTEKRRKKKAKK